MNLEDIDEDSLDEEEKEKINLYRKAAIYSQAWRTKWLNFEVVISFIYS